MSFLLRIFRVRQTDGLDPVVEGDRLLQLEDGVVVVVGRLVVARVAADLGYLASHLSPFLVK